jgi:protein-S-isoprenylcysteine O-methyltransferase Ste14
MAKIKIAVLSLISAPLYFSLVILGWGSWRSYFADPARSGLVVVLVGLCIAAALTNSSGIGPGVREDKSNRWVLAPLILGGMVMPWLMAYLDRHNECVWGGEYARWIGLVICLIGGCLRLAPVFVLGRRFSGLVAIQPGHTLETGGLYKYIRHPSYLGLITCAFGWALVFRCLVPGLIMTALLLIPLVARMNSEERLLVDQFGEEYASYKKRTWRMAPWIY